jgi:hypothetical protein
MCCDSKPTQLDLHFRRISQDELTTGEESDFIALRLHIHSGRLNQRCNIPHRLITGLQNIVDPFLLRHIEETGPLPSQHLAVL